MIFVIICRSVRRQGKEGFSVSRQYKVEVLWEKLKEDLSLFLLYIIVVATNLRFLYTKQCCQTPRECSFLLNSGSYHQTKILNLKICPRLPISDLSEFYSFIHSYHWNCSKTHRYCRDSHKLCESVSVLFDKSSDRDRFGREHHWVHQYGSDGRVQVFPFEVHNYVHTARTSNSLSCNLPFNFSFAHRRTIVTLHCCTSSHEQIPCNVEQSCTRIQW